MAGMPDAATGGDPPDLRREAEQESEPHPIDDAADPYAAREPPGEPDDGSSKGGVDPGLPVIGDDRTGRDGLGVGGHRVEKASNGRPGSPPRPSQPTTSTPRRATHNDAGRTAAGSPIGSVRTDVAPTIRIANHWPRSRSQATGSSR